MAENAYKMYTNQSNLYCSQLYKAYFFFFFDTLTQKEVALKQNYLIFAPVSLWSRGDN